MAKNQSKRIAPAALEADRSSFAALQALEGYAPANTDYTLAKIAAKKSAMDAAQQTEAQALAAAAAARDDAAAFEWEFHNLIIGAKDQVVAQYGRDSNEVQSLGLKKTSEYKTPQRRKTETTGGA